MKKETKIIIKEIIENQVTEIQSTEDQVSENQSTKNQVTEKQAREKIDREIQDITNQAITKKDTFKKINKKNKMMGIENIEKVSKVQHTTKNIETITDSKSFSKLSKTTKGNIITYGMVIVAYIIMQILIGTGSLSSLIEGLLVPICIYVILAISLNLTVGILGELSLGHAGFMCIGAFSSASFSIYALELIPNDGLRFMIALVIGAVCAAIFGILIGIPVLRLRGDYLAIVTLAFGEIIKNVVSSLYLGVDQTGVHLSLENSIALNLAEEGKIIISGAQGISGTAKTATFTIGIIVIIVALIIILNLINSRAGRAIMAIRDNRIAAESLGINVTKYKLMAFSISASIAGVAGVLYAHNLSTLTASSKNFGYNMSIMILVFVVLGGIGNIRGSIIAAVLLTVLPELLRGLNDYRMLIYAIVLIVMMLFNWSPKAIEFREKYSIKKYFSQKKLKKEDA